MVIEQSSVKAIIWDYDGTLVDTRQKNYNVARKIIGLITGEEATRFSAFESLEIYDLANRSCANWRELYLHQFGLTEDQTDRAGQLWTEYQLGDATPTPVYDGIHEVIQTLGKLPQGIVSMNSKSNIEKSLEANALRDLFQYVVGYEEVGLKRQKPEPDGLLACIERLTEFAPGTVVYIGDHETDVKCAANANLRLSEQGLETKLSSVGVFYGSEEDDAEWEVKPDFKVHRPSEIPEIIRALA